MFIAGKLQHFSVIRWKYLLPKLSLICISVLEAQDDLEAAGREG